MIRTGRTCPFFYKNQIKFIFGTGILKFFVLKFFMKYEEKFQVKFLWFLK